MSAGPLPLPPRATLADPGHQEALAREGFVRVPLLDDEQAAALRAIYEDVFPEAMGGFVPTYALPDPERKAAAGERVRTLLEPLVAPLFDRHRAFNTSFLMKWPGDDSALPLHQDTCYVDERVFRSAVVWIALDETNDDLDNGPLHVVPGSHRFDDQPRGTRTWWPYDAATEFLEERCLVSLPADRGDALIMDNGLIHCSFPNRSEQARLAVAIAMAPEEAGLVHAVGEGEGRVTFFDVDEAFFVEQTPYLLADHGMPDGYRRREVRPVQHRAIGARELAERCGLDPPPEPDPAPPDAVEDEAAPDEAEDAPGQGRVAEGVFRLMQLNNRVIDRVRPPDPVLDPASVPWTAPLEREWKAIRAEAEGVLEQRAVPRIEEVVGRSQGNRGDWRTFVLVAHRETVPFNASQCPRTIELLDAVPGLQSALLSVFAPGTHLPAHNGPNRGVLRYHLGLVVPDPPWSCRLRVDDQLVAWEEGGSILFDDTFEHEAWNDADEPRVTLLLEVTRPLPAGVRQLNQLTQRAFGLYPEARGSVARLEALEWALNGR